MIQTPCIKECKLVDGVCTGCRRTIFQIRMWSQFVPQQRKAIMEKIYNEYCEEIDRERMGRET